MASADWRLEGEWIKNCNCAFGCRRPDLHPNSKSPLICYFAMDAPRAPHVHCACPATYGSVASVLDSSCFETKAIASQCNHTVDVRAVSAC